LFGMRIADKVIKFIINNDLNTILGVIFPFRKLFNNKKKDK